MKIIIFFAFFYLFIGCSDESIKPNNSNKRNNNSNKIDTVKICNMVWMKKNLDLDHYRNGDSIPEVEDPTIWATLTTGAWCYYENDTNNRENYGKLYNWYAVNDPRGLGPDGWHVPSDSEWIELQNCLGGEGEAGGNMKSIGTIEEGNGLWYKPNEGATNESGFSANPGAIRNKTGFFMSKGIFAYWWSSTETSEIYAISWYLYNLYKPLNYDHLITKNVGLSVRCVKN